MSPSPEFNEHTELLHESLSDFLASGAISLSSGCLVAAGLLNYRRDEDRKYYRPRLVVISGAADLIRRIIEDTVRDEVLLIGAARQDDPESDMGRVFAACPGTAKDVLQRRNLEEWEVMKLGSKIRESEQETLSIGQADFYYQRVYKKLYQME